MCDAARRRLAVGFFDGVHLGHRAILAGADAALTFRNHPLSVLKPECAPGLLTTFEEREAAIRSCGVKDVIALDFDRALADMPADEFAGRFLRGSEVRCGDDWRFGARGEGCPEWLRRHGYAVSTVGFEVFRGGKISSSRIRSALDEGDVAAASAMLGRRYSLSGVVSRGKGLGGEIGFPTVNLHLSADGSSRLLRRGVYEVSVDGVRGVANYGVAPSMGDRAWPHPVLEINFPGVAVEFPEGSRLTVEFARFIRPEMKFSSLDGLRRQIARDIAAFRQQ